MQPLAPAMTLAGPPVVPGVGETTVYRTLERTASVRYRSLPVTYGLTDRELWPYWPGRH